MTELEIYADQFKKCRDEFPKFKTVVLGSTFFSKILKFVLRGAAGITFWNTVYIQEYLVGTEKGANLLAHEIVHVRDQHKWLILFPLSYLLLLPIGPSFKAVWEWRAYKEDLKWVHEHPVNDDPEYQKYLEDFYCQWVASVFCGPMYLWMWPFKNYMYKKCTAYVESIR